MYMNIKDSSVLGFWCHQCAQKALIKHARGQNISFQNGSPLMCFCGFATRQFYTLKTQSIRHDIEMFKVKISSEHPTSNTNLWSVCMSKPLVVNFTVLSMEIPITNCFPFFFQTNRNLY